MKDNNQLYHLVHISQESLAVSKGFKGRKSTDGQWFIIGKGDTDDQSDWIILPELPQYMIDLGIEGCCLDYEQAYTLSTSSASEKGASDGYTFYEDR